MLKSLNLINSIKSKNDIPSKEKWLKYLFCTSQKNVNLRNVSDISKISSRVTLDYVKRTLEVLEQEKDNYDKAIVSVVEDVLKWSEVAKTGSFNDRESWKKKYDLEVHNEASAEIYKDNCKCDYLTYVLIKTHGLVGQYIQGEVNLDKNFELTKLILDKRITKEKLYTILVLLNECVIKPVRVGLYDKVKKDINKAISDIVENNYSKVNFYNSNYLLKRFKNLFPDKTTEEFEQLKVHLENNTIKNSVGFIFENFELWYPYAALRNYKLEEILKIFLITKANVTTEKKSINFNPFMDEVYYMYKGMKVENIFKQRIIESYLANYTINEFADGNIPQNEHIEISFNSTINSYLVGMSFSIQAQKLIEFCEVAYGTSDVFNQSVYLLYDLFGFRRDKYDRFYNEISYLNTMNSTIRFKTVILDYIKGKKCLDVGPGGGALLDLLESTKRFDRVVGIDVSSNVIEALNKKKAKDKKKWEVIKGDALNLKDYFKKGEIDTIIFCSVMHELFSYIETDGKKFNHKTIEMAIKSCYDILPKGGRIIIRDGIMSETNKNRIIVFKDEKYIKFLDKYCRDFKGRDISYKKLASNKVMMKENDAMEFLYTFTWGEESYPMEVQEQFGYYTPSGFLNMFKKIGNFKVIECNHYLQEGYEEHLLKKVEYYDEDMNVCRLPDSTCVIVVEKV
jgi:ubiquinone/menaquinone biosynthesis C-methylase UbiE